MIEPGTRFTGRHREDEIRRRQESLAVARMNGNHGNTLLFAPTLKSLLDIRKDAEWDRTNWQEAEQKIRKHWPRFAHRFIPMEDGALIQVGESELALGNGMYLQWTPRRVTVYAGNYSGFDLDDRAMAVIGILRRMPR